jgi:hypothetical protein
VCKESDSVLIKKQKQKQQQPMVPVILHSFFFFKGFEGGKGGDKLYNYVLNFKNK